MKENKEIKALFSLMDDPDEEIYSTVENKLISLGVDIIPNLEHYWESIENVLIQERVEGLIHKLQFADLQKSLDQWLDKPESLLEGALILEKYKYPDLDINSLMSEAEKIRKNIWLELNIYLTPLEQINVINSIFYNYYKFKGEEIKYSNEESFFTHRALQAKKGNAIALGILYVEMCRMLDIPVAIIPVPRQFLMAYFDSNHAYFNKKSSSIKDSIKMYIESSNGQIYFQRDIDAYLKKLNLPSEDAFFEPMNYGNVLCFMLSEWRKCYPIEEDAQKHKELLMLQEKIMQRYQG